MFAKCLSVALALSLLHLLSARHAQAQTNATAGAGSVGVIETGRNDYAPVVTNVKSKEAKFAAKVKADIAKLGTGPEARIEVKLRDKTKLKGYVGEAGEDSFVIVDDRTGTHARVPYPQVKQAKGRNNLSGDKIGIILVIALIVVTAIGYARK